MAIIEDPDLFLSDFGVPVASGALSGIGILDMPSEYVADGMQISTDYSVRCRASVFGGLKYGNSITVDSVAYTVREIRLADDGVFVDIALSKPAA